MSDKKTTELDTILNFIEDEKMDLEELKQLIAQIEQEKNDRKS